MPEGDTIHHAARRVGAALVDREIESIETPQPRHHCDRWPERLDGRRVRAVDARGKHLLVRFESELTLHSHLRMVLELLTDSRARFDPWRRTGGVSDDEVLRAVRAARPLMQRSAERAGGS